MALDDKSRKCSYCRRFVWLSRARRFCHTCWWTLSAGLRLRLVDLCTGAHRPPYEDLRRLLQEAFEQLQLEPEKES